MFKIDKKTGHQYISIRQAIAYGKQHCLICPPKMKEVRAKLFFYPTLQEQKERGLV